MKGKEEFSEWLTPRLQHNAAAVHGVAGEYEAPLFGAYSKKVGMWLFLASDSLTFRSAAVCLQLQPDLYGVADAVWQRQHHQCDCDDGVSAVEFADDGDGGVAAQRHDRAWTRNWLLATMAFGTAFIVLHGMEWTKLIHEGLTLPGFPKPAGQEAGEYAKISVAYRSLRLRSSP